MKTTTISSLTLTSSKLVPTFSKSKLWPDPLLKLTFFSKPTTRIVLPCLRVEFSEAGFGSTWGGFEEKDVDTEPPCPPGLRKYETMMILRPDMSEDQRVGLIHKYEQLLFAGGGLHVEVFNSGVIPLSYSIKTRNRAGESNTYHDGIQLRFTYYTKPESIAVFEATMRADDDVIRSMTTKPKKRKY